MIIEDPDSFKAWLTSKLEPLCDADPAALAKYVYALVRKDKPVEELRASMLGQLEVFLQRETQGFVDILFRTLETQNFEITPAVTSPVVQSTTSDDLLIPILDDSEKKKEKDPIPVIAANVPAGAIGIGSGILVSTSARKEPERHLKKSDSDKEDRSRRGRRRGSSGSPDRRRSRSRSFERRRSRSRDRDRGRAWRNKSPPPRRYERRRSYSKSPRRYSKSRSPQSKRNRYRNRSPPRSRSRTPLDGHRRDSGAGVSPRDTHGDTDLRNIQSVVVSQDIQGYPRRCRDFDEKGFCMRGDLCPYDHGTDPVILEDVVPMYNGGPQPQPPIMSQPVGNPNMMHIPAPPPPLRPPPPQPVEYNPDAPSMEPRVWRQPHFRGSHPLRGMGRGAMGRGGFPIHQRELINVVTAGGPPYRHRPPLNHNSDFSNGMINHGKNFDFGRIGTRAPFPGSKGGNTTLQLKKVPIGVNNITHLNNHFSKFGKIVNIQVGVDGDLESALITFSNHTEANIAIKSTEAVLNNRFIRVFWYNVPTNNENKQENTPPTTRPSALERLGAPPSKVLNNIQPSSVQHEEKSETETDETKVTLVNNSLSKTLYIASALKKEPLTATQENKEQSVDVKKKIEEITVAKKKQEEARKAGVKLNADLRKRKTELLEKQINQQKLLIQRTELPSTTPEQKAVLISTIKTLQESIETIRKDLAQSVKANLTKVTKKGHVKDYLALVKKTKEEVTRELLDAELDLMNGQNEGKNTEELKKKVADLRSKSLSLGMTPRPAHRGRGSALALRMRLRSGLLSDGYQSLKASSLYFNRRGRGRGTTKFVNNISYEHNIVDHRPTKLLVSGYEQDDKTEVIKHFEKFGEIVDYLSDDATPSLVLNYKVRKDAEVALTKGRNFHDRLLSVTWASHHNNIRTSMVTKPPTPLNRPATADEEELAGDLGENEEEDDAYFARLSPSYSAYDEKEAEEEGETERSWKR